jgi:hypothetical protein
MSTRMRILLVAVLVSICVAIQVTIILLIRRHYRKLPPPPIPDSVKFPWRQFEEYGPLKVDLIQYRLATVGKRSSGSCIFALWRT